MSSPERPLAYAQTSTSGSFSEFLSTDHALLPFLHLLHSNNLISLPNFQDTPLNLQIKIHLLAYIAQNVFGLNLRYKYGLYKNTPYSTMLLTDCSLISNPADLNSKSLSSWQSLENFIEFATAHNDTTWLDIASTLLFARLSYNILNKNVVMYVSSLKPDIPKHIILDVYNTLSRLGYI